MILHVPDEYDSLLQIPFKTEFVTTLKKVKEAQGLSLRIVFMDKYVNGIIVNFSNSLLYKKIETIKLYDTFGLHNFPF